MMIHTARHGEVDIDPATIITIGDGIIGFPRYKRFVLLPFMEGTDFELLQAVDHPNLGFVTLDPYMFMDEYTLPLSDDDQDEIHAENPDDLMIRVIVTIPENPREMTANLQGPIVINRDRMLAKQVVLPESQYGTKYKVFGPKEA